MRRILVLGFAWLLWTPACFSQMFAGAQRAGGISDLVLIYQGGTHRLAWTGQQLSPYVTWTDRATQKERWLFDGFLFIEFKDNRGHEYAHGYHQKPAQKEDWTFLLDRAFAPHVALSALDSTIESAYARLGEPSRSRKVVLTLPEPIIHQKDWGTLDGDSLDFDRSGDRVSACRWYVQEALRCWGKAGFSRLTLAGFYWVAEYSAESVEILPLVSDLVKSAGMRFYWIPYWNAAGAGEWEKSGFNVAYQQPNHFFHPEVPDNRLDDACRFAEEHGMGMEFECDQRAISDSVKFRPRFSAYIDAFRRHGAWADAAVAYYEGGGALLAMSHSTDPAIRTLYDKLAAIVASRQ